MEGKLFAELETPLPELWVSATSAVFLYGFCFHPERTVRSVRVLVDGVPHRPQAQAMPRLDVLRRFGVANAYRSGFWATLPVPAPDAPGDVTLAVEAHLDGGGTETAQIGRVPFSRPRRPEPVAPEPPADSIAICMATYNPDSALLGIQLESIKRQTDERWICLISDDCSDPERFDEIVSAVGDDERFVISRSPERIGFYRNFERALMMLPPGVELVALADQDDRWYPDKLATLRGALGDAGLVYSDMRLVDPDGNPIRDSLWEGRRNNHTNLASMLVANSVAGAASLIRRDVVELALPFPHGPGWEFHDHWLGSVALAGWRVAYVDRPLYDYVQHPGAILGQVSGADDASRSVRLSGLFGRWRTAYFRAYAQVRLQVEVIAARCEGRLTSRKRRALRLLAGSERRPWSFAWLALRPLRRFTGRDDTLGAESLLVRGILWRWLLALRVWGRREPRRLRADASLPPLDIEGFSQRRIRRWRAGR